MGVDTGAALIYGFKTENVAYEVVERINDGGHGATVDFAHTDSISGGPGVIGLEIKYVRGPGVETVDCFVEDEIWRFRESKAFELLEDLYGEGGENPAQLYVVSTMG